MTDMWPTGRSEEELLERVYGRAKTLRHRRRAGAAGIITTLAAAALVPALVLPGHHPSQAINTANQAPGSTAGTSHSSSSRTPSGAPSTGQRGAGSAPVGGFGGYGIAPGGSGGSTPSSGAQGGTGTSGPGPLPGSTVPGSSPTTVPSGPTTTALPGPKADSVSPQYGPTTGGTTVTITGTDLSQVTEVLFGTTPARSFSVRSATAIVAVTPAASSAGMVPVGVYDRHHHGNADSGCWTNPLCTDGFLYVPPSPVGSSGVVLPTSNDKVKAPDPAEVRHLLRLPQLP